MENMMTSLSSPCTLSMFLMKSPTSSPLSNLFISSATSFPKPGSLAHSSSRTSLRPRTQILTASMNSMTWNLPSLTKAARLMLPRRQLPPAGSGSSAQGFVPA